MLLTLFCWIAVIAFIIGNVIKFVEYQRKPMSGRQDLYPIPAEEATRAKYGGSYYEDQGWYKEEPERNLFNEIVEMLEEIFFIKKLFKKQKSFWWISYALHLGIYCVIASLVIVVAAFILPLGGLLLGLAGLAANIAGIAGGILVVTGAVGLIVKRVVDREFRVYTTPQEFFNLGILGAAALSGILAWISHGRNLSFAKNVVAGMARMKPIKGLNKFSVVHILLFGFVLLYIPVTKMTHYVGKFFAFHNVIWGNQPNLPGSKVEETIIAQADIKPDPDMQWSAPHYKN